MVGQDCKPEMWIDSKDLLTSPQNYAPSTLVGGGVASVFFSAFSKSIQKACYQIILPTKDLSVASVTPRLLGVMEWHLIVPIVAVPSYLMRSFAESVVPKDHRRSREVVKLLKLQLLSCCFDCYRLSLVVMKTEKKVHLKRGTGKCWLSFPMVNWRHWIPLISWGVVKQRARLEDWYGKTAPETPPLEQPTVGRSAPLSDLDR